MNRRDPKTMGASDLKFSTTAEPLLGAQAKADIVVDVRRGVVVKNRFGKCPVADRPVERRGALHRRGTP